MELNYNVLRSFEFYTDVLTQAAQQSGNMITCFGIKSVLFFKKIYERILTKNAVTLLQVSVSLSLVRISRLVYGHLSGFN